MANRGRSDHFEMVRSSMRRHLAVVLAGGAAAAAFCATTTLPAAASGIGLKARAHVTISCALVSSSLLKSDLGVTAGSAVSTTPLPGEVRCAYKVGSNALAVQAVFNSDYSLSNFQSEMKAYEQSGYPAISGIGEYAYVTSEHTTGTSYSDITVYVKGGTEVAVGASGVALSQVETLAKRIVAEI